jgi:hypothetical protein
MKIEAVGSSETLVTAYENAWCNTRDHNLNFHYRENLKSD